MEDYLENPITKLRGHKFRSSFKFYLKTSFKEARRRKFYYCLAIASTIIVVAATALAVSLLSFAPLIFLKSAEAQAGTVDVTITSKTARLPGVAGSSRDLLLNYTQIADVVYPVYPNTSTPRYSLTSGSFVPRRQLGCGPQNNYASCTPSQTYLNFIDTEKENYLGIGSELNLGNEIPRGQVVLTDKLASILGAVPGDTIVVQANVQDILLSIADRFNFLQSSSEAQANLSSIAGSPAFTLNLPYTLARTIPGFKGKYNDDQGSFILLTEYKYFFMTIADSFSGNIGTLNNSQAFIDFLRSENPEEYAFNVIFNMKNRKEVYQDSNFDSIQDKVINFSSDIADLLGIFPFSMSQPVNSSLSNMSYVSLFLGITLKLIIIIIFLLSTILIYNLLMVTLETRAFDFGVIRILGLRKVGIVQLILIQALSFVIPGIIIGLGISIPLLVLARSLLQNKLGVAISIIPTVAGFAWSIGIGILIPILSSYYPVKEALSKNLNDALDLSRSKTSAVKVKLEVESKKIPWGEITFGFLTIAFGVGLYILLPKALISNNLGLLLWLFFIIIFGFLFGLALIAINFQHLLERLITILFFFWTKSMFRSLVLSNLTAHRLRNRQVSIMYALSLGFVIFLKVALKQQLQNASFEVQAQRGAYIVVDGFGAVGNYATLEQNLYSYTGDFIDSYAWITQDLSTVLSNNNAGTAVLTHTGQLYTISSQIVGVSSTIFQTSLTKYLKTAKHDEDTGLDLGQQLYTPRGSEGLILGEYPRQYLAASLDPSSTVVIQIADGINTRNEEFKVLASLESAPAFTFSNSPFINNQNVLVSMPTFRRLLGDSVDSIEEIPMSTLLIKVIGDSNANLNKAYSLISDLKKRLYPELTIWDFRDSQAGLDSSTDSINIIFIAIEILAIILSLFSLMTSMSTNILEQTKEIAVLKALGMRKYIINMIYVSEAFVLVISSALFGIVIGTLVGFILALQGVLFTNLPLQFVFPYIDLIVILVAAVLSAFLSSYLPARRITKLQISKIARLGA